MHGIFADAYLSRFGKKARQAVLDAARHIVRCNILQGDALEMTTVGDKVMPTRPLVFTADEVFTPPKLGRSSL